jgi:hypothetical protein
MLSGVLSFKLLQESACLQPGANIILKLVSDSRTLVNKINKRLHNRRTTNQHHDSDVDLESIGFVRSYQELKKVKSDLSYIELLNVMADSLTKSARKLKRKAIYTSLPQNPVDFTINDTTINSKYSLRSKKSYHSIYLRAYFQDKYAWPNNIIDSIWWKPYHNSN